MKKLSLFPKLIILFAALGLFITSCDPDEPLIIDPTISLVDEAGYVSSDDTVAAGETFLIKLTADKGDGEMNTLTVQKDGSDLSTDLYTIDGGLPNNPTLLFDGDRTGFTYDIAITAHDEGSATYSFIVDSDDTGSASTSVEITVAASDPVLVNNMNPSITIPNPGFVKVIMNGTKGSGPLSSITVFEEGAIINDLTRLSWNGTQFDDNPYLLLGDDKEGFTGAELLLRSNNTVGTTNYTITLTDEFGNESSIPYSITVEPLATPLVETTGVLMYNNSGPNFGAIDLATLTNVSSGDASADLVDSGIDGNGDWMMTISPESGTDLRSIEATYTYDNVNSLEDLTAAFDGGTSLSETGTITVGSTYAAQNEGKLYLLTATAVNNTDNNNEDFFTFSVKTAE